MSNGKVASVPGGQSWIAELHRKVITISSFFSGQTRSSRVVIPDSAACGDPNSPTTVGAAGFTTSTMRMPGCVWTFSEAWHGCTPPVCEQGGEPSVRFPT